MLYKPSRRLENKLFKKGYKNIIGADEAGRGAWAGPVVAAAVILPPRLKIKGLKDSKLLNSKQRESLNIFIQKNALQIGIGVVGEKIIDKYGIINATRQAFLKAIKKIEDQADYLLVDGIKIFDHKLPIDFLIKGDLKIYSIAAASIIAKVARDHILQDYHKKFPQYGFDQHKGYGTKLHKVKLDQHGVAEIHRMSYRPIINKF